MGAKASSRGMAVLTPEFAQHLPEVVREKLQNIDWFDLFMAVQSELGRQDMSIDELMQLLSKVPNALAMSNEERMRLAKKLAPFAKVLVAKVLGQDPETIHAGAGFLVDRFVKYLSKPAGRQAVNELRKEVESAQEVKSTTGNVLPESKLSKAGELQAV